MQQSSTVACHRSRYDLLLAKRFAPSDFCEAVSLFHHSPRLLQSTQRIPTPIPNCTRKPILNALCALVPSLICFVPSQIKSQISSYTRPEPIQLLLSIHRPSRNFFIALTIPNASSSAPSRHSISFLPLLPSQGDLNHDLRLRTYSKSYWSYHRRSCVAFP